VAAALVVGATRVEGSVQLTAPSERAGVPVASKVLVESASLVCPGQQRLGAQGMRDVSGSVQVSAAAAPTKALDAVLAATAPAQLAAGSGRISVETASAKVLASTDERLGATGANASGSGHVVARGAGVLAPGVAATQGWLRLQDDDRGLALTACTQPSADVWLLGGGGGASRTERVVIANPGANAVTVRLEVHGAEGKVEGSGDTTISIPPLSRSTVSLDAIAPQELRPAVHVIATGGVVTAVLNDAWIDGATARGVEDATAAASPAQELVIAGVEAAPRGQGETTLRLVNPAGVDAVARVTVLTGSGPTQPAELRAVPVAAGATLDLPLTLAAGSTGLRITSDQKISGAVLLERREAAGADREGDFGWAPALPPLGVTGGAVIPALGRSDAVRTLHLAAGRAGGKVTTTFGAAGAARTLTTTLAPDSTAVLPFGDADRVWVSTAATDIRATATVVFAPGGVPYYSVLPIPSAPTTETSVPVRQVTS
jgi:hypothetical protein